MATHSYRETLKHRGLQPFLWTQFLGAFNDNLFKIVVSMLAVHAVAAARAGRELSIVSAVFILPFLLFSGYAGQLADVYSKRTVLVVSKSLEIVAATLERISLVRSTPAWYSYARGGVDGAVLDGSAHARLTRLGCRHAGGGGGGEVLREPRLGPPAAAAAAGNGIDRAAQTDAVADADLNAGPAPVGDVDRRATGSDVGRAAARAGDVGEPHDYLAGDRRVGDHH
jgi:MFS family permease